jgi:tetratricopeptide (TPR) repeat protein
VAQAAVVSRALRQAAVHEASGDTDLEIAALENIAVAYPGSPDAARALLNAAALEAARGNYAEASGAYQRVLALPGRGNLPQALAYKGLGDLRRREVGSDEIARHNYGQAERILRETARKAQGTTRSEALVALGEVRRAASFDDEILAAGVAVPAAVSGSETLERTSDIL